MRSIIIASILALLALSVYAATPTSQPASAPTSWPASAPAGSSYAVQRSYCPIHLGGKIVSVTPSKAGTVVRFKIERRGFVLHGKDIQFTDAAFLAARLCEFTTATAARSIDGPGGSLVISMTDYKIDGTGSGAVIQCKDVVPLWHIGGGGGNLIRD
jgi:hypothetical protein